MTATHTSRRNMLKGAAMLTAIPVAVSASAIPFFDAGDEADTPVMQLYRRWRAYRDWLNGPETREVSEDEFNRLVDALDPMEREMEGLPVQNMTDLAAKVLCLTGDGEMLLDERGPHPFASECRALLKEG
ncbi:hypothetical protein Rumeso_05003 [Rubellimicrobium mesophilum DSM 19309]|uniref:Twin-arginine translocation pathway signal n=1 Tax=Rubellimicrobium mesophilum DSM 19309 TaxID=442562 RepID=A0A017HAV0_9RHOB|nr:hypothetical protein [Rubellimicrobium mesophilum]EYD71602.1 hypothetical protein Rumeso_05003 [Rubellimicrobium mesophilum DSM 19309]